MKRKHKYLIIACILSIFVLLIGDFILAAAISLRANTMLITKIRGMKIIVASLKAYEEKNGKISDCESMDELIRVLKIDSNELKRYLLDISEITYDSKANDEKAAILFWQSDIRASISPESFLEKYHFEMTYCRKHGLLCGKRWESK